MRTMARCTSGTVRELALLDGVTHSARSPVCLIKHHAGCSGVRVLVTERARGVCGCRCRTSSRPCSSQPTGKSGGTLRQVRAAPGPACSS